jgi:hypothetical protein
MVQYFVDSSAFYAAKDPSDRRYAEAVAFMERVRKTPNLRLVTSNFILDETLTLIRMKLGHQAAVQFGQQIRESRIVEVIRITEALEERAWQIFVKYSDKDYSFTDCTSFAVMEERSLSDAFAFDEHFVQHGLIVHP